MLSKDIFKNGIESLAIFYPTWNMKIDEPNVMKAWYLMFEEFENDSFLHAINTHVKLSKFNPTVASLLELIPFKKRFEFDPSMQDFIPEEHND